VCKVETGVTMCPPLSHPISTHNIVGWCIASLSGSSGSRTTCDAPHIRQVIRPSHNDSLLPCLNTLPCPHIPYGMQIFHGIHMDSMDSTWIPHGFHMEWKYSMDSTWNGHVFIPYGMGDLVESRNLKKCIHLF